MSTLQRLSLLLLLTSSFVAASSGVEASPRTAPEARDAKKDTKITTQMYINNLDDFGAMARCSDGEYKPITAGIACYLENGERMQLKVYTKTVAGTPDQAMIYEVTAHNGNSAYICDDKGAIERGYAATFREIVQGQATKDLDVCTTVTKAGHNTTRAELVITEKPDGIYVEFRNLGGSWKPTGGYPNTTGQVKVDFSLIPE